MFVVKMDNGRGFVEWYESLAVRMQAHRRDEARQFRTEEAAQQAADNCLKFPSAFAGIYFDDGRGCYTMHAVVEPL